VRLILLAILLSMLVISDARAAALQAGPWSITASSCGSGPSGTAAAVRLSDKNWLITIAGTIGTGTITSCKINFFTDGTAQLDPDSAPNCIGVDNTNGTVLMPTYSGSIVAGPGSSYGSVTLTVPSGVTSFGGHAVQLWCMK
jgi:hypothetical protein